MIGKNSQLVTRDFAVAVKDIKLAILQARAKAARLANAGALKLYFFVGWYISKKTCNAKWGSGAIDALSNQLQIELPGLRGFSAMSMKYMRLFFEAWAGAPEIRHLATAEIHYLPSKEFDDTNNRQMKSADFRPTALGELDVEKLYRQQLSEAFA